MTANSLRRIFAGILSCAILISLSGCASTNLVRNSYAPRLSAQSQSLEKQLKEKSNVPVLLALGFGDARAGAGLSKKSEAKDLADPYFIWKGKGMHTYRLEKQTLADYLHGALVFDLERWGFKVVNDDRARLLFADIAKDPKKLAGNADYVIAIDVLQCEPRYKVGWNDITPSYHYTYHMKVLDVAASKTVYDNNVERTVEGLSEAMIMTFASMTDRLMSDNLTEMDFTVANILLQLKK